MCYRSKSFDFFGENSFIIRGPEESVLKSGTGWNGHVKRARVQNHFGTCKLCDRVASFRRATLFRHLRGMTPLSASRRRATRE